MNLQSKSETPETAAALTAVLIFVSTYGLCLQQFGPLLTWAVGWLPAGLAAWGAAHTTRALLELIGTDLRPAR